MIKYNKAAYDSGREVDSDTLEPSSGLPQKNAGMSRFTVAYGEIDSLIMIVLKTDTDSIARSLAE